MDSTKGTLLVLFIKMEKSTKKCLILSLNILTIIRANFPNVGCKQYAMSRSFDS
jgi:hypothetical protein